MCACVCVRGLNTLYSSLDWHLSHSLSSCHLSAPFLLSCFWLPLQQEATGGEAGLICPPPPSRLYLPPVRLFGIVCLLLHGELS